MMAQQLTDSIEAAVAERASTTSTKNKRLSEQAETSNGKAEDEKFLADLTAECEQKSIDFGKRQELRQGELDAIQKAIDIMGSDAVAGSGDKHLPGLVQQSATVLVQLRSSSQSPIQHAVATFLND